MTPVSPPLYILHHLKLDTNHIVVIGTASNMALYCMLQLSIFLSFQFPRPKIAT